MPNQIYIERLYITGQHFQPNMKTSAQKIFLNFAFNKKPLKREEEKDFLVVYSDLFSNDWISNIQSAELH